MLQEGDERWSYLGRAHCFTLLVCRLSSLQQNLWAQQKTQIHQAQTTKKMECSHVHKRPNTDVWWPPSFISQYQGDRWESPFSHRQDLQLWQLCLVSYAFPNVQTPKQNRTTYQLVRVLKDITSSSNFHFVFSLQIWGSHSQNSLLGPIKSTLDLLPLGGLAPTSDFYFLAALISDSPGFPVLVPILDSWPWVWNLPGIQQNFQKC